MTINNISIDLTNDSVLSADLEAVIRSVIIEFTAYFSTLPPAGVRPIKIFYCPDRGPIVDSTTDTGIYNIGLTVNSRYYDQLVYQLSHELCHIFADPRRSNWFVECCCEMLSQTMLLRLADVWATSPPFSNWTEYAPVFENYLRDHLLEQYEKVFPNCPELFNNNLTEWLKSIRTTLDKPCERARNTVIANLMRPLFERPEKHWDALCYLGYASSNPPVSLTEFNANSDFQFDKWLDAVPESHKFFVSEIKDLLAPLFA